MLEINVFGDPIPGMKNTSGSINIVVDRVKESAFPNSVDLCLEYWVNILKSDVGINSTSNEYCKYSV